MIYKGKYIVNWCPRCHTALADDEVEHEDKKGHLWHIRYPYKDGKGHVTVDSGLARLLEDGRISAEEAYRRAQSKDQFEARLSGETLAGLKSAGGGR